jgi:hypothetical protein
MWLWWRAPLAVVSVGRRAAAFIPSGCPRLVAAGAWGGSRAGSGINQTRRPPAGGGGQ